MSDDDLQHNILHMKIIYIFEQQYNFVAIKYTLKFVFFFF